MSRDAGAGIHNDERELRALSVSYAAAVDFRDGDRLAGLFVEDGELVVPDVPTDPRPVVVRKGSDSLRRVPDGLHRYVRTFHVVSNHEYEIDGGRASGTVSCIAHHITATDVAGTDVADTGTEHMPAGGTDTVWFIRYADEYQRTATGWRILRRVLQLQWIEERPVVLISPE